MGDGRESAGEWRKGFLGWGLGASSGKEKVNRVRRKEKADAKGRGF